MEPIDTSLVAKLALLRAHEAKTKAALRAVEDDERARLRALMRASPTARPVVLPGPEAPQGAARAELERLRRLMGIGPKGVAQLRADGKQRHFT